MGRGVKTYVVHSALQYIGAMLDSNLHVDDASILTNLLFICMPIDSCHYSRQKH